MASTIPSRGPFPYQMKRIVADTSDQTLDSHHDFHISELFKLQAAITARSCKYLLPESAITLFGPSWSKSSGDQGQAVGTPARPDIDMHRLCDHRDTDLRTHERSLLSLFAPVSRWLESDSAETGHIRRCLR